ncbi:putative SOS response-associated peptidase YedK [compost metagenome]
MCGRYVSPSDRAIEDYWHIGARNSGHWIQRFNVAPTSIVPMLRLGEAGELEVVPARWGLIPPWWKDAKPPAMSFNARSEEAASKPMWRQSLRAHRCLMPARGWYEWNQHQEVRSPSGRKLHQPFYLHDRSDGVLAIAGLWTTWRNPEGQQITSCALLTKEAAPSIHAINDRMPVILAPEQFDLWLSPNTPGEQVQEAIASARQDFVGHAVSLRVNSAQNDDPQLIEQVADPPR